MTYIDQYCIAPPVSDIWNWKPKVTYTNLALRTLYYADITLRTVTLFLLFDFKILFKNNFIRFYKHNHQSFFGEILCFLKWLCKRKYQRVVKRVVHYYNVISNTFLLTLSISSAMNATDTVTPIFPMNSMKSPMQSTAAMRITFAVKLLKERRALAQNESP